MMKLSNSCTVTYYNRLTINFIDTENTQPIFPSELSIIICLASPELFLKPSYRIEYKAIFKLRTWCTNL